MSGLTNPTPLRRLPQLQRRNMTRTRTETVKDLYDNAAILYAEANPVNRHPETIQFLIDRLTKGAKVLDGGCAFGRETYKLKKAGCNPVGVDISENEIQLAKQKYPGIDFCVGDLLRLNEMFSADSFDAVYCSAALDHIRRKNYPRVLSNFHHVLKPDGYLLLTTRNGRGVQMISDTVFAKPRPITRIEEYPLRRLLTRCGFTIEDLHQIQSKTRAGMSLHVALCRKISSSPTAV